MKLQVVPITANLEGYNFYMCYKFHQSLYYYAESAMDYEDVDSFLCFYPCVTRRCRTLSIVDDLVDEADETFIITLERVSGLNSRIILNPSFGEIEIADNNGIIIKSQNMWLRLSVLIQF